MRAIQKLVARLDAGEPIVVGAVGGSVTAAHGGHSHRFHMSDNLPSLVLPKGTSAQDEPSVPYRRRGL